jgi:hypothetical protein
LATGSASRAGPLLIAAQTQDPLLVALGGLLGRLPWLLFGLYAGALADRIDRRLMVVAVDLMRAGVLAVLAVAIAGHQVSIAVVLVRCCCSAPPRCSPTPPPGRCCRW